MRREHAPTAPQRVWTDQLRNGTVVRIRPLAPGDGRSERAFLSRLPLEALAQRFVGLIKSIDDDVVRELTCMDPACGATLGAFAPTDEGELEVGVATCMVDPEGTQCCCSVTVDPSWQKLGVGRALMRHLIDIARERGIRRMYAADAERHGSMHALAACLGFRSRQDPHDPAVTTYELIIE